MYIGTFLQDPDFIRSLYIIAFSLFIIDLRLMNHPRTARRGNVLGAIGMAIAVIATLLIKEVGDYGLIVLGVAIGAAVGIPAARSVKMTAMPQMVALFNGVGGGAVALISFVEYRESLAAGGNPALDALIPALFAAIIGSVSFWGSIIAFGKLQEMIPGRPIQLPGQQFINLGLLAICVGCATAIASGTESEGLFIVILVAAAVLGNMFVLPIGGADMPVVISLLERLHRPLGGRGRPRARQRRADRGRDAGGRLGLDPHDADGRGDEPLDRQHLQGRLRRHHHGRRRCRGQVRALDGPRRRGHSTRIRSRVAVVPGYGLAVAQAQHTVRDLANELEKRGVEVKYAIHPVAGRMPGHMNVLLAEADVPYEQLREMDDINPELAADRRGARHRRQRHREPGGGHADHRRRQAAAR